RDTPRSVGTQLVGPSGIGGVLAGGGGRKGTHGPCLTSGTRCIGVALGRRHGYGSEVAPESLHSSLELAPVGLQSRGSHRVAFAAPLADLGIDLRDALEALRVDRTDRLLALDHLIDLSDGQFEAVHGQLTLSGGLLIGL